jgi:hypothetical protein
MTWASNWWIATLVVKARPELDTFTILGFIAATHNSAKVSIKANLTEVCYKNRTMRFDGIGLHPEEQRLTERWVALEEWRKGRSMMTKHNTRASPLVNPARPRQNYIAVTKIQDINENA